jgi:hypothetical protein
LDRFSFSSVPLTLEPSNNDQRLTSIALVITLGAQTYIAIRRGLKQRYLTKCKNSIEFENFDCK